MTIGPGGDLVLSFDTTVSLGGASYGDQDLVRFDGASFSLELDASAAGLDAALDLDAVDCTCRGAVDRLFLRYECVIVGGLFREVGSKAGQCLFQ